MGDEEMSQKLADELAQITKTDQRQAATAQVARMLVGHYKQLLDAGFTRVEAPHLTGNYQTALVLAQSVARERDQ